MEAKAHIYSTFQISSFQVPSFKRKGGGGTATTRGCHYNMWQVVECADVAARTKCSTIYSESSRRAAQWHRPASYGRLCCHQSCVSASSGLAQADFVSRLCIFDNILRKKINPTSQHVYKKTHFPCAVMNPTSCWAAHDSQDMIGAEGRHTS